MTLSSAIYCNNAISTGLLTASSLDCKNNLTVSGSIFISFTSYFVQQNDNCFVYIGDDNYYNSSNTYGTLSIS